jgi:NADP-dependent 3-hydroxy acid dehydrogenase YdfG
MKTVAITGHTKGIGQAISQYFQSKDYMVHGYSRSNGYDISHEHVNRLIVEEAKNFDVFVNNASHYFGQPDLLIKIMYEWHSVPGKTIINIGSRYTWNDSAYCMQKRLLNEIVKEVYICQYECNVININPGLVDTGRVRDIDGKKMTVENVIEVLDYALQPRPFRIHEITFGI